MIEGRIEGEGREKRKRVTVGVKLMRKEKRDIDTRDWEKR